MKPIRLTDTSQTRLLLGLAFLLVCIAGFRQVGFDRDSLQYLESYQQFSGLLGADFKTREPTFWLITAIAKMLPGDGFRWVLFAYAALGMAINVKAIQKISPYPIMALICFAFLYFPLHTMTQIRASIACGLLLLAIPDIADRRLKDFLIKVGMATLFHYSAIILVPLYLIRLNRLDFKLYAILPLATLAFSLVNGLLLQAMAFLALALPEVLGYKISIYLTLLESEEKAPINLFSLYYLSVLFVYYLCIFNIHKFSSKYEVLCIKILGWSLGIYYAMSFLPVVAVRISEMLGVVIVIVIPALVHKIRGRNEVLLIAYAWLFVIFFNNVILHELFNF
jgi:hypothetical protein